MDIALDIGWPDRAEAELWHASEPNYRAMKRLELVDAWSDYYLKLAEIHERIADENRERAARLFASLGGGR